MRDRVPRALARLSVEARDRHVGVREYERVPGRADSRTGGYERDLGTLLGTRRVRIARTRRQGFLPVGLARRPRRAPAVPGLSREACLRGMSTRPVGRVIAWLTEEPVRAQTVSQVTRELDHAVAPVHRAPLGEAWRYRFWDGISLRGRRPRGRKRVPLLVA